MTKNSERSSKADQSAKNASAKSSTTKKISIGKLVEKATDILKKPFQRAKKADAEVDEKPSVKNLEVEEAEKSSQATPKPKARKPRRKKETILVDYPTPKIQDDQASKRKPSIKTAKKKKRKVPEPAQFEDYDDEEGSGSNSGIDFSGVSSEVNGFFYTNDQFLSTFEDAEILKYLKSKYPMFMKDPADFLTQKKQIIEMLSDAKFMESFLSRYDMTIFEFFKFLFRLEPDLFKGSFLKRVQRAMRYKKYAINAKKCSYVERKRARLSAIKKARRSARGEGNI